MFEAYDAEHSDTEDWFRTLGLIRRGLARRLGPERAEDVIRIISARLATRAEQALYNEHVRRKP